MGRTTVSYNARAVEFITALFMRRRESLAVQKGKLKSFLKYLYTYEVFIRPKKIHRKPDIDIKSVIICFILSCNRICNEINVFLNRYIR